MSEVRLEQVTVQYPQVLALDRISLTISQGEFLALLGPSGCGKTTAIRVIGGFTTPDEGSVFIDRKKVERLPPYRRNMGIVFQNYALFPHKTVFGNIAFGLRMKKEPKSDIERKVNDALKLLHLSGFEDRYPNQLSGGQQQRVALARALVTNPSVLLLDEPLAALDKKLREEMQIELRGLQKRFGITTVFVTHDQEEALTMADRIAILNLGRIEQVGSPSQIYERPANRFVSDFIGMSNILPLKIESLEATRIRCNLGGHHLSVVIDGEIPSLGTLEVAIRPEKIKVISKPSQGAENVVQGEVESMIYRGSISLMTVKIADGVSLLVQLQNMEEQCNPRAGERVYLQWPSEACKILNR
jgi:spermidine/putrescine ABC transporter ATP-binding subunit